MRNFKRLMSIAAGLMLAAVMVVTPKSSVSAAEPTTWYVRYDVNTQGWYSSTDQINWSSAYLGSVQAGDNVVVDGCDLDTPQIALTSYQPINELAFSNKANVIVNAPSVNHVYSIKKSVGVVNANVVSADAYYDSTLQINGNVDKFVATYEPGNESNIAFGVSGTVGQANVIFTGNRLSNSTTIYNVAAGKLVTQNGFVHLTEAQYSLTAPAAASTAAVAPAATAAPELDDVPKTGTFGVSESILFFALSAVFAIGAVMYKKKMQ